jgi:hypothetical protein
MPHLSPQIRRMPRTDVEDVLSNGFYRFDESYRYLIRNYHAGMTLRDVAGINGISSHRASTLVHKFIRRCQLPSNWRRISEQSRLALT